MHTMSWYLTTEITKKVYNNIMNSIQIYKMRTIFLSSKSSKTLDPHRLVLDLSDKINLKRTDKYVTSPNLTIYYKGKMLQSHIKKIKLI